MSGISDDRSVGLDFLGHRPTHDFLPGDFFKSRVVAMV